MSLMARGAGRKEFELCPEGTYPARCVSVIDLGTQDGGQYGPKRKVRIGWQVCDPDVRMSDGRRFGIFSTYTLSLGEKSALRRDLTAWRGRPFTDQELEGFDLTDLLGAPCLLSVVHNTKGDRTYANVAALLKPGKAMQVPEPDEGPVFFSLESYDATVYQDLSEYLREKIAQSPEWQAIQSHDPLGPDPEDDIPF